MVVLRTERSLLDERKGKQMFIFIVWRWMDMHQLECLPTLSGSLSKVNSPSRRSTSDFRINPTICRIWVLRRFYSFDDSPRVNYYGYFLPSPSVSRKYWNNFRSCTDLRTLLDRQGTPSMTEEINSFRSMASSSLGPMLVPETMHCSAESHKVPFTLTRDVANVQR